MRECDQPSLSDILCQVNGGTVVERERERSRRDVQNLAAEAEWRAAIAALAQLLTTLPRPARSEKVLGCVISGPLPVLTDAALTQKFATWVVTPQPLAEALMGQRFLMPHKGDAGAHRMPNLPIQALPLLPGSPLLKERFCFVLTPEFGLGLVLGHPAGRGLTFQYSFDPDGLRQLWERVKSQVESTAHPLPSQVTAQWDALGAIAPDYRLVSRFSQALMTYLPHRQYQETLPIADREGVRLVNWSSPPSPPFPSPRSSVNGHAAHRSPPTEPETPAPSLDTELLQAMAHEIRTPLTTIRTLTRSLLRRSDLAPEAIHRLQQIDQACTQQIDRFNLIFRAAELEKTHPARPQSPLAPIALSQIFQEAIPQWQQQAQRRNLSLDVTLPPQLPRVTSDPTLLHQVLTGVVEWFTQYLPAQSHIQMHVIPAGHQLKLQFEATCQGGDCPESPWAALNRPPLRSLGQLLMFAPETGGLSLNLDVTKNLFQALGGKLIVRQRPQQGDVLTVFLPLETREV